MPLQSPKSWRPAKLGRQIGLNPDRFRQLIFRRGSRVLWEKAARCPCTVTGSLGEATRTPTHEPQSACPECFGIGFLHHDPQEIQAVVLSASKNPAFYQLYGEQVKGMVMITVLPEHMPKSWDRFTVLDSVHAVSETRERTGAKERLRYPIASANLELADEDTPTVKEVTAWNGVYIRRANASGQIVPAPLVQDLDCRITPDGELEWLAASGEYATGEFVGQATPGTIIPAYWRFEAGILTFVSTEEVTADEDGNFTVTLRCEVAGEVGNFPVEGFKAISIDSLPGFPAPAEVESAEGTSGGVDGNTPAIGERYTIDYWASPTYVVNDTPHPHRDGYTAAKVAGGTQWARYPVQVHCWLETMGPPHGYKTSEAE
ncbi:MAG TPA: hypothetical protein DEQ43_09800 [Nocardioides bacterium]|nr:hypothetical protein [Nocardioides sp.]